ncbi:MAG: hypothetical protein Q9187_005403 [Circinaria calcarea]
MTVALQDLGYQNVYHMRTAYASERDVEQWIKALEAKYEAKGAPFTREQWDQLLGQYKAVTDIPCAFFAEELIEAYPEAKVILTTRSPDSWYGSMMQTAWAVYQDRLRWIAAKFDGPTSRRRRLSDLFFQHFFRNDFPRLGKTVFIEHNDNVRRLVPPERFLEHQARDGWDPLCKFLGKEVPRNTPYPKTNDVKTFRARFEAMNRDVFNQVMKAVTTKAIPVLLVASIICWKAWGKT